MTAKDLSLILKQPNHITLSQVYELENIIHQYPYFQVVKAIYLRVLYAEESYRYNKELKITAAHIGNRTLLFDFITSSAFRNKKNAPKFTTYVTEDAFQKKEFYPQTPTPSQETQGQTEKEALHMGKPIDFQPSDKQSFATWLEVTRYKPIDRRTPQAPTIELPFVDKNIFEEGDERAKKFDLIDKFLESNPKIEVNKDYDEGSSGIEIVEKKNIGQQFMTETLAKVYLEQGKYTEAIQAYQVLMLKNPAKSAYFAEQIAIIRKLQQNK